MKSSWGLIFFPLTLFANPTGYDVVAGDADVKYDGTQCTITTGDRSIIQWEDFSNRSGESILFIQPQATSAVLNRVVGDRLSEIFGELKANGQIFLINQKGVVFGKDALIDCRAFSASTLDVLDDDFLNGRTLQFFGESENAIENHGRILANEVNFYSRCFKHDGKIDALRAETKDGRVVLLADAGKGEITGKIHAPRGEVHILGRHLFLYELADIDVSSAEGGGTVLVGGDFRGENRDIPNSDHLWLGAEAKISADATERGNGGKVILWSQKETSFIGSISAKGGKEFGNGGFVEVSSKGMLSFLGEVTTEALKGEVGTLFLDPISITISDNPTTLGLIDFISAYPNFTNSVPNDPSANLLNTDLQSALSTNSVVIATSGATGGAGNITWIPTFGNGADIVWTTNNNLSLLAHNNITIQSNIENGDGISTPTGNITLVAGWDGSTLSGFESTSASYGNNTNGNGGLIIIGADLSAPILQQEVRVYSEEGAVSLYASDIIIGNESASIDSMVSVGSRNGQTSVYTKNDLSIFGGSATTAGNGSQLGFRTTSTQLTANGPIHVDVGNKLVVQGGSGQACQAAIGHVGGRLFFTNHNDGEANAEIDLIVRGRNIVSGFGCEIIAGEEVYSSAQIGHGGQWSNITNGSGNIALSLLNGDLLIQGGSQPETSASIGHGNWGSANPTMTIRSDISIQVLNGDILIDPNETSDSYSFSGIFHFGASQVISSSISVESSRDIQMLLPGGYNSPAIIGSLTLGSAPFDTNCCISVKAGRDILLQNNAIIGHAYGNAISFTNPINSLHGDVHISAARDLRLSPQTSADGGSYTFIGFASYFPGSFPNSSSNYTADLNVVVGRNLSLEGYTPPPGSGYLVYTLDLVGVMDTSVAVGGMVNSIAGLQATRIGSLFGNASLWAEGDIIFKNGNYVPVGAPPGLPLLPFASVSYFGMNGLTAYAGGSLDLRSGGDICLANDLIASTSLGQINLDAGALFGAGDLWRTDGASFTSIATHQIDNSCPPVLLAPLNLPSPLNVSSSAKNYDGYGAIRSDNARYNTSGVISVAAPGSIAIQTVGGAINFHSGNRYKTADLNYAISSGDLNRLILESSPNNFTISTISGNIDISSDDPMGGFQDIAINQSITTAGGAVYIRSMNRTELNNSIISGGGAVTLIADGDHSGTGDLNLNGAITSSGGSVYLKAGPNTFCSGDQNSIVQLAGTIASGGGSITALAANGILISGGAPSISTTSGPIFMQAGGAVSIFSSISTQAVGGSITIFSGRDILIDETSITAVAAPVTLIIDHCFNEFPFFGTGGFYLSSGSSIGSGSIAPGQFYPLQIFTAAPSQNRIEGKLNGFDYIGSPFADSYNGGGGEVCTYYPDSYFEGAYTIFYKQCSYPIVKVSNNITSQYLFQYLNEPFGYSGEIEQYQISYDLASGERLPKERYFLRRTNYGIFTGKIFQPADEFHDR